MKTFRNFTAKVYFDAFALKKDYIQANKFKHYLITIFPDKVTF